VVDILTFRRQKVIK